MTADCIVITKEDEPKVLLVQRGGEPFKGCWAFPGGFMNMDETTEQCAIRELEEETGLKVTEVHQIGAYSKVDRDPRGRTVTVAYLAIMDNPMSVKGQDDAEKAEWWDLDNLPPLAFDHTDIMKDAIVLFQMISNNNESGLLMTSPHCDSVRLRQVGLYQDTNIYELHSLQFTNRYFILSHPDSCALMGQPEVVDFMARRSLLSQTVDAFRFLQDQGLGRNLDILTILRGGLNYPLEEACWECGIQVRCSQYSISVHTGSVRRVRSILRVGYLGSLARHILIPSSGSACARVSYSVM